MNNRLILELTLNQSKNIPIILYQFHCLNHFFHDRVEDISQILFLALDTFSQEFFHVYTANALMFTGYENLSLSTSIVFPLSVTVSEKRLERLKSIKRAYRDSWLQLYVERLIVLFQREKVAHDIEEGLAYSSLEEILDYEWDFAYLGCPFEVLGPIHNDLFFMYASGEAQKRLSDLYPEEYQQDEHFGKWEDSFGEEHEDPFSSYNCDSSNMQWLNKEMIAEVIMVASNLIEDFCDCCHHPEGRDKNVTWHDEDCEGYDGSGRVIIKLYDGRYALIETHGSDPRDYHGGAIWTRTTLKEILSIDTDEAMIR